MISGGPKDTITSLWTKGLKALVPPNSFGPPTMVGVVVDFKDRGVGEDFGVVVTFDPKVKPALNFCAVTHKETMRI